MAFQKPRILSDSEANTIRGKMLVGHATIEEQFQLIGHLDLVEMRLRGALETLSGCLPAEIYVYGDEGQRWTEVETEAGDEYETINFIEILG